LRVVVSHNTVNDPACGQAYRDAVAGLLLVLWLVAGYGWTVRLEEPRSKQLKLWAQSEYGAEEMKD